MDDDATVAEYYEEYDTQPVPGDQDSTDETLPQGH